MSLDAPAPTRTSSPRPGSATIVRACYLPLAALVTFALVAQLFVTLSLDNGTASTRVIRMLSYFTIQANALVCATSWGLVLRPARSGLLWRVLWVDAVVGISVTGVVFSAVLAGKQHLTGWAAVCDVIFHYIVPISTFLIWLVVGPRGRVGARAALLGLIWPLAWYVYTLIHGAASDWYPYPFVNVTTHGYGRVILNGLIVLVLLGVLLTVMWWVDHVAPSLTGRADQPDTPRSSAPA